MNRGTLFVQKPSWLLLLLSYSQVRSCDRIIFFQYRDLSLSQYPPIPGRNLKGFLHLLNPHARVETIPDDLYLSLWLENNASSDPAVDRLFAHLSTGVSFHTIATRAGLLAAERYTKICLLPWVLSESLYYRIGRHLTGAGPLRMLSASSDRYGFHTPFFSDAEYRAAVPRIARHFLRFKSFLARACCLLTLFNILQVLAYILEPLVHSLLRGRIRIGQPPTYSADVVTPLINGFAEPTFKGAGHRDDLLLNPHLPSDRVLFYFSSWKFPPQERAQQIEQMKARGIRYVDPEEFPLDPRSLWETLRFWGFLTWRMLRPAAWTEEPRFSCIAAGFARHYLRESLFANRVRFKVSVEFQDYSPTHVVRTVLADRLGRLTVGMHHGSPAAPWVLPTLRYTHIHRHCIWGEAFLRMHEGHWDPSRSVPVGFYRIDRVRSILHSARAEELQRRYTALFGGHRPLVVLLLPSLSWYILRSRVRELLEGLRRLQDLTGSFQLVCRFRAPDQRKQWMQEGLAQILAEEPRVTEDISEFSTPEWMALSDLVISSNHSTGMIESAGSGKPCVTFDFMTTGEKAYGYYDPSLILKNSADLVAAVRATQNGNPPGARGMTLLAQDFSFYTDGRNAERFRDAILQAVEEVDGRGSRLPLELRPAHAGVAP